LLAVERTSVGERLVSRCLVKPAAARRAGERAETFSKHAAGAAPDGEVLLPGAALAADLANYFAGAALANVRACRRRTAAPSGCPK
jgi:hypothetical protein